MIKQGDIIKFLRDWCTYKKGEKALVKKYKNTDNLFVHYADERNLNEGHFIFNRDIGYLFYIVKQKQFETKLEQEIYELETMGFRY